MYMHTAYIYYVLYILYRQRRRRIETSPLPGEEGWDCLSLLYFSGHFIFNAPSPPQQMSLATVLPSSISSHPITSLTSCFASTFFVGIPCNHRYYDCTSKQIFAQKSYYNFTLADKERRKQVYLHSSNVGNYYYWKKERKNVSDVHRKNIINIKNLICICMWWAYISLEKHGKGTDIIPRAKNYLEDGAHAHNYLKLRLAVFSSPTFASRNISARVWNMAVAE